MTPLRWLIVALWCWSVPTHADHGPDTWNRASSALVRVLPTWPGHDRPGFGAPFGTAPMGSGFFISSTGETSHLVLTAAHVIDNAVRVEIETQDGQRVDAAVIHVDWDADLAVLRTPLSRSSLSLKPRALAVGSHVCALGHPFGLPLSISCGVISGTDRQGLGFNAVEDFVQTDAAVNPGSSGGALVDAQGQLVGLVSAIFTKDADIDAGVNFAVSVPLIVDRLQPVFTSE